MDVHEVVKKLIGPIQPVGSSNVDDKRFENLKAMTELVDKLLKDIDAVIYHKYCVAYTMKRAGKHADEFFTKLGIEE